MSEIRFKEKDFMDKLDWEWEEFSCNVTSLSRENIFSMAEMVADKKHIYLLSLHPKTPDNFQNQ